MKKILLTFMACFAMLFANAWTVYFTNPDGWTTVNVWAWADGGDGKDIMGTGWPGKAMTNNNGVWEYTQTAGDPDYIIFNDGKNQTGTLDFEDGATYNKTGVVGGETYTHTVYFKNTDNWDAVYVYCWDGYNTTAYPGEKLSANTEGLYPWVTETSSQTVPSAVKFQFNNGLQEDAERKTQDIELYTENAIYDATGKIVGTYDPNNPGDVTPDNPDLTAPENLYLIGNVLGSNWNPANGLQFETTVNGVFSITGVNLVTTDENEVSYFAVTGVKSADWDEVNALRWGPADQQALTVGEAGKMAVGDGDSSWTIAPGVYDFVIDFENATIVATVSEETSDPDPVEIPTALYLLGNLEGNDWTSAVAMTSDNNGVFTLEEAILEDTGSGYAYVTFVNTDEMDWDVLNDGSHRYGPAQSGTELVAGEAAPFYLSGDSSWKVAADIYSITVNFNTQTVLFSLPVVDGIESLNSANSEDVIYNLQGVRVNNPSKGLYIINGKKVLVR